LQPVGFVGRNWVTQLDFSHITKNFLRRKRFEIQQNPLEHSDISFARGCCPAKIHILGQSPTSHKWQPTDSTPPRPNPISLSVPPIAKRPTTTHPAETDRTKLHGPRQLSTRYERYILLRSCKKTAVPRNFLRKSVSCNRTTNYPDFLVSPPSKNNSNHGKSSRIPRPCR